MISYVQFAVFAVVFALVDTIATRYLTRSCYRRGWDEGWLAGIRDGRAERDRLEGALSNREVQIVDATMVDTAEGAQAFIRHLLGRK